MELNPIQLFWQVSKNGYEVETFVHDGREEFFLRELTSEVEGRFYRPLEEYPGLFMTFSNTDETLEGILGFANKYGLLGSSAISLDQEETKGEGLRIWIYHINELRFAINLWNLLRSDNVEGLKEYIVWDGFEKLVIRKPSGDIETPQHQITQYWRPGDVIGPAKTFLSHMINAYLTGGISPTLSISKNLNDSFIFLVPNNLLYAMWLQFAQAITGNKSYGQCEQCGTYFEIGPRAGRKGKKYCSDACRMAAYRRRKVAKEQM